MPIEPGTKLGRYEIRSKIGAGGMGDVYLARDTKLDRRVALKILPADVASQRDRMDRFVREAKAAAALNHPNIAHVYEIDESGGTHFIAMEFVDGFTFRALIHGKQTDLAKLLRYLQQAAEGLAKAHAAGIVHRDFKPDNVMVTREGHAKILDFGLAKLVEPESFSGRRGDEGFSEIPTALMKQHSTPGAVLGTVGYMSPEQAQGKVSEIDHRSDIFSFGCILYEAVTRRKAFEGKDAIDSLNKIIREQPASINSLNPDSPHELQRIVRRCLAKDPDDRYQTIKAVAIELRDLRRELEESGHTTTPPATDSFGEPASSGSITGGQTTPREGGTPSTRVSSAEYIISGIKQHKMGAAVTAAAILIVVIGGAYGIYKLVGRKQLAISFQRAKFTRLTSSGKVIDAAISPDGKWLVHVVDDGGQQSLWLRQVAIASSNTQIVPLAAVHFTGEVFSPDGNYVYYSIQEERGALYKVPVLGGTARKLRSDVDSAVAFSPDGKQIAYFHYSLEEDADKLMIANADGSNERQLARRGGNESLFAGANNQGSVLVAGRQNHRQFGRRCGWRPLLERSYGIGGQRRIEVFQCAEMVRC